MPPYGFADGGPTFPSYDALVASGYRGVATVDGVVYAWSDTQGKPITSTSAPAIIRGLSVVGDSIAATQNTSFYESMIQQSAGRYNRVSNLAVGGTTSAQALAVAQAGAAGAKASGADAMLIQTGKNDTGTISETIANIKAIAKAIESAGMFPILCPTPPNSTSSAEAERCAIVAYCIKLLALSNHWGFLDAWGGHVNSDGTGYWKAGASYDTVHPYPSTAFSAGATALADLDKRSLGPVPAFPRLQTHATAGVSDYGLFLSPTAGIGAGWTVAGSGVTPTTEAASDVGNTQVLTISGATGNVDLTLIPTLTDFPIGSIVYVCGKFDFSGFGDLSVNPTINLVYGGANTQEGVTLLSGNSSGVFFFKATIPVGTTSLKLRARFGLGTAGPSYSGVAKFSRVGIVNATTFGIA